MPASERTTSLRDLPRVFLRHKFKVFAWCLFVVAAAAAVLFVLPKKYTSDARLYVRLGRESVSLDPTATTGQTMQVIESRENQINSARDLLLSRTLLESVVEELGAETILKGSAGPPRVGLSATLAGLLERIPSIELSPPVSPAEQAVGELSKSIKVTATRNSSVLAVSAKSKSPQLAQKILDAFLNAYHDQHMRANRTSGSQEFFARQAALLNQQLDYAKSRLRDAKNEAGLVSIPVQQQAVQSQLLAIESAEMAAQAGLVSSEASVARLNALLAELPTMVPTAQTTGFANAAADSMKQELFKAQMSLRELEAKLGDSHPQLKVAREQVNKSEAIVAQQVNERAQSTKAINSSYQALDLDLRREDAMASALRAKLEKLGSQYAELRGRLNKLNEQEVRITDLEQQVEIATGSYRAYSNNLEQARINQALEDNRISNLNVVQPPSLVEKPSSPQPVLVLAVAAFMAFSGSMVLAFGSEYLNSSLRHPSDIETQLELPVLAAVPRVRGDHVLIHN